MPSDDLIHPDPGNNATFWDDGYTIGAPYWRTEVGAHENSQSPYGTFDQDGNVWEWNEAILDGLYRGERGGSAYVNAVALEASNRYGNLPTYEYNHFGFRVAQVPEPASVVMLALGVLLVIRRR